MPATARQFLRSVLLSHVTQNSAGRPEAGVVAGWAAGGGGDACLAGAGGGGAAGFSVARAADERVAGFVTCFLGMGTGADTATWALEADGDGVANSAPRLLGHHTAAAMMTKAAATPPNIHPQGRDDSCPPVGGT